MENKSTQNFRQDRTKGASHIIVLANEKGGSGKSTTAMHVAVYLLRQGYRVGCLDLDARQGTLRRYIKNRLDYVNKNSLLLSTPTYAVIDGVELDSRAESEVRENAMLAAFIDEFRSNHDYLIIDTPGSNSSLALGALEHADTLLTPMNDSFIDLDILGEVDPETNKICRLSHYAETVFEKRKVRASRGQEPIDWILLRNRIGTLDNNNNRAVGIALEDLAQRIGFRCINGFTERVVFRELFPKGLTMLDLRDLRGQMKLSMSHIAARQEVAQLVGAIRLEPINLENSSEYS